MIGDLDFKHVNLGRDRACSRCRVTVLKNQRAVKVMNNWVCRTCWFEVRETMGDRPAAEIMREFGIGTPGSGVRKMSDAVRLNPRNTGQRNRSWHEGDVGERLVGNHLDRELPVDGFTVLHSREHPNPRRNSDFDHLVVSAIGLTVIDAKNMTGEVTIDGWDGPLSDDYALTLRVNGKVRNELVTKALAQAKTLRSVVAQCDDVAVIPVFAALCFTNTRGLARTQCRAIHGVQINRVEKLCDFVRRSGPLTPANVSTVGEFLARMLPPR